VYIYGRVDDAVPMVEQAPYAAWEVASRGPQADLQGVATVVDCQILDDISAVFLDSNPKLVDSEAEGCFLLHELYLVAVPVSETD